jgi:PhnB protein
MKISAIPKGFHTITPNVIVDDAPKAIAFLSKAFGAEEIVRLTMPDGKVVHCELQIGDSRLNLGESMEGWPAHTLVAQLYVENSDELFKRALAAGATEMMPMTDMFLARGKGASWILSAMFGRLPRKKRPFHTTKCSDVSTLKWARERSGCANNGMTMPPALRSAP